MRHLTSAKTQGDFGFVAFFQKLDQVTHLDLVIAFVGARSKLYFLDLDLLLLQLGLVQFFRFLVTELAVIHDAAHGWDCRGGNFNQIEIGFFSQTKRFRERNDPEGFLFGANQPDVSACNFTVDPDLLFLSYSNVSLTFCQ